MHGKSEYDFSISLINFNCLITREKDWKLEASVFRFFFHIIVENLCCVKVLYSPQPHFSSPCMSGHVLVEVTLMFCTEAL